MQADHIMLTIKLPSGQIIKVAHGKRLVLALEDAGMDVLHRCGGHAKCTTCRCVFFEGEPSVMTTAERDRLAESGLMGQFRLSCQIECTHDMTLREISRLSESPFQNPGVRPQDQITPTPEWVKRR
jgi:ferredoxin